MSVKKAIAILIGSIQILLLIWAVCAYVSTRLELMEARNLILGLYKRDTDIRRLLHEGADVEQLQERLSTNQHVVVQYAVRRNVMRSDMFRVMFVHYKRGELDLNEEKLRWFQEYCDQCSEWEGGNDHGDFKNHTPIIDQIEMVFYLRWKDRIELWKTWKPNDFETNIKLVSPKKPYEDDPVSIKIYRFLEYIWGQQNDR